MAESASAGPAEARSAGTVPGAPRAVIVAVGDELLLGETVNTNQAWLGRELTRLGLTVVAGYAVGDGSEEIRRAVERALGEADVVFVTGGLGPTPDDRTKEVVAEMLGRPLELRDDLLEHLEGLFRNIGYDRLPPANRGQAEVPKGALCLPNPRGSAPCMVLSAGAAPSETELRLPVVVLMPGVPREVHAIYRPGLEELLSDLLGPRLRPTFHRMIHTTGIAESVLTERVEEALPEEMGPVTLASLPGIFGVSLRLSAREMADEGEAREWLDRIEARLRPVVEPYRYDSERGDIVDAVTDALVEKGRTLSAAESCTGGLIGERLTRWPGGSRYFLGGVICYSNASKIRDLDVPEELIREHGAVSEPVVEAMVRGVARRFESDAAVAVTGIAGPDGGSEEKPVGTVWMATLVDGDVDTFLRRIPGDRESVRQRSAQAVLHRLLRNLARAPSGEGDS